jgi:hypothetical protein
VQPHDSQRGVGRSVSIEQFDVGASVEQGADDGCVTVTRGADQWASVLGLVVLVGARLHQDLGQLAGARMVGVSVEADHADVRQG